MKDTINIEMIRKTHKEKKKIFTRFCICLVILGGIIFYNAYIVRETYIKQKQTFVETSMQVVAFNKISDEKSNAICKYRYKEYEYAFTCYTLKTEDIDKKYKIGDTKVIKVNPDQPDEILTNIDIELYTNIIFVIDITLVIVGIVYSYSCVNKSKKFVKKIEKRG